MGFWWFFVEMVHCVYAHRQMNLIAHITQTHRSNLLNVIPSVSQEQITRTRKRDLRFKSRLLCVSLELLISDIRRLPSPAQTP